MPVFAHLPKNHRHMCATRRLFNHALDLSKTPAFGADA
jgi:hypothetical protein